MAYEVGVLDLSFTAAEDLSAHQYRFVHLASDTTVDLLDSATEMPVGILQNAPESGETAVVRVMGVSKLVMNGAVTVNTLVMAEYVGAADNGKGDDAGTNWPMARSVCIMASGAEDDVGSVLLCGPYPSGSGTLIGQTTVTTEATAGAVTYTAAELLGGLILRDCAGGARSDVTPTAVAIVAAINQAGVGNSFEFTIRNTSNAAETLTLTAGTDVTLSGTMTIAQNNSKRFLCVITSSTAATIYSLGTVVH